MKNTLRSIAATAVLLAGVSLSYAASHGGNTMVGGAEMFPDKNIVENAVNSADHTTLVAAVKAAGLVDTLMGEGPFTVFAPTNAAFSALPDGTVDTLLKPENKDKLVAVLTYHVVAGKVISTDLVDDSTPATVQGSMVTIDLDNGAMVNDAKVVTADIDTSNGVIHVIDKVLVPEGVL